MARSGIGENIARFRKAAGINQEELGKAVGVSAQAVSRWECGGTPDVELLPSIADQLRVSVDALFGRGNEENLDLHRLLYQQILQGSAENAQRMKMACDYVWTMQKAMTMGIVADTATSFTALEPLMAALSPHTDRSIEENSADVPWQFVTDTDEGIMACGMAEDINFAMILPEPSAGYASVLKRKDDYIRLFQLLAKPHYLDMLLMIYRRTPMERFTGRLAAASLGISVDEAQSILDDLYIHCMVKWMEVADETGTIQVYHAEENNSLLVMLFFCNQMMHSVSEMCLRANSRSKPSINDVPGSKGLAPEWKLNSDRRDREHGIKD